MKQVGSFDDDLLPFGLGQGRAVILATKTKNWGCFVVEMPKNNVSA